MGKIAFVFPGQGAQFLGMGKDFYNEYPIVKEVFQEASDALGYSMEDLCFNSSEDELKKTENTQPAVLTVCYAMYRVLKDYGVSPDQLAGLSLGEYTALVAANVIDFKESVKLVRARGKYMQEEVPMGVGGMAAIIGLEREKVHLACNEASVLGIAEAANYNCSSQIVIAGELEAVKKAGDLCKEYGAKRAIMLPVSAPFHTSLLKGAGEKLSQKLKEINYGDFTKPVVTNVTADYINNSDQVKDLLVRQVSSPVMWEDSIQRMIDDGVDTFIEIGPGKSVSKFIKRISKKVNIHNVSTIKSFEKTLSKLKGE